MTNHESRKTNEKKRKVEFHRKNYLELKYSELFSCDFDFWLVGALSSKIFSFFFIFQSEWRKFRKVVIARFWLVHLVSGLRFCALFCAVMSFLSLLGLLELSFFCIFQSKFQNSNFKLKSEFKIILYFNNYDTRLELICISFSPVVLFSLNPVSFDH